MAGRLGTAGADWPIYRISATMGEEAVRRLVDYLEECRAAADSVEIPKFYSERE